MSDKKRKPVLEDHVALKRKLIPPVVNALGDKLSEYSWTRQLVPEAIWMALIIDRCGYEAARKLCLELVRTTNRIVDTPDSPMFARFSAFVTLNAEQKAVLASGLEASVRNEVSAALRPLSAIASAHPLAFLEDNTQSEGAVDDRFPMVLRDFYDRSGRLAVLSMALAYFLGIEQGKIHVAPHLADELIERFRTIGDYPNTEAAERAAGAFRASAPMLFMTPQDDGSGFRNDEAWVSEFWNGVAGFGPCVFHDTLQDEDQECDDPMEAFVVEYRNAVRADLRERLRRWPLNLNEVEAYEVVSALLCRQASLAIEFASSPAIWSPHTAPIILRAIADVFITLAWILKDPSQRSKQFVEDGLGAIKLQIAHYERALEQTNDPDEKDEMRLMIEIWREWLAGQRMDQFVEVNPGSWSGLSTRKMADEAGFLDFYNYVYQPFSGVAHSNWAHVSAFNAVHCQNPAHRWHRAPAIAPTNPDPHWLFLATKYLSKTLGHFDDVNGFIDMPHRAFDVIGERIVAGPSSLDEDAE